MLSGILILSISERPMETGVPYPSDSGSCLDPWLPLAACSRKSCSWRLNVTGPILQEKLPLRPQAHSILFHSLSALQPQTNQQLLPFLQFYLHLCGERDKDMLSTPIALKSHSRTFHTQTGCAFVQKKSYLPPDCWLVTNSCGFHRTLWGGEHRPDQNTLRQRPFPHA